MIKNLTSIFIIVTSILAPFESKSQDLGDPNCDSLLLVSSWQNDNVKIYDGCNASYIRDLDDQSVLNGPQAIFENQAGDVVVLSEQNHRVVKFDRQTLSGGQVVAGDDPATAEIEPRLLNSPLAAVTTDDGHFLIGGFTNNNIVKVDPATYEVVQTVLPASTQHLRGLDIGMAIGPDGQLYVPGFDSDNIIKVNLETLVVTEVVQAGVGGLDAPRAILFHNDMMYVTAWRTGAILRYDMDGRFIDRFATLRNPTGIIADGDGFALVASDRIQVNKVVRLNLNSGAQIDIISASAAGNLNGATYVYRLLKQQTPPPPQSTQLPQQHWMIGIGEIQGNKIHVEKFSTTRGGAFGDNFDTTAIDTIIWGQLDIEFTGCNNAAMSYQSGIDHEGLVFGSGGYDLIRLASNQAVLPCLQQGFDNITEKGWMSGTLYGSSVRSGEGFLLDVLDQDRVIVTWYTYLPEFDESRFYATNALK